MTTPDLRIRFHPLYVWTGLLGGAVLLATPLARYLLGMHIGTRAISDAGPLWILGFLCLRIGIRCWRHAYATVLPDQLVIQWPLGRGPTRVPLRSLAAITQQNGRLCYTEHGQPQRLPLHWFLAHPQDWEEFGQRLTGAGTYTTATLLHESPPYQWVYLGCGTLLAVIALTWLPFFVAPLLTHWANAQHELTTAQRLLAECAFTIRRSQYGIGIALVAALIALGRMVRR